MLQRQASSPAHFHNVDQKRFNLGSFSGGGATYYAVSSERQHLSACDRAAIPFNFGRSNCLVFNVGLIGRKMQS